MKRLNVALEWHQTAFSGNELHAFTLRQAKEFSLALILHCCLMILNEWPQEKVSFDNFCQLRNTKWHHVAKSKLDGLSDLDRCSAYARTISPIAAKFGMVTSHVGMGRTHF